MEESVLERKEVVHDSDAPALLRIEGLSVAFGRPGDARCVVEDVRFGIGKGEKLALVGESGSGKSVTALSILRLHDPTQTFYPSGQIFFEGHDLISLPESRLRQIRGRDIGMVFQEPMTSLNPVYTVGEQLIEPLCVHEGMGKPAARRRMIELLERVGIPQPHKRFDAYPHMLSGGQRQRVMIAMALACNPKLLIADEPTTALDVTVQQQILELLEALQREFHMAVLLITHDLNMVRRFADRICVMQQGRIVEEASVDGLFAAPRHAYTRQLLASEPRNMVDGDDAETLAQRPKLLEGYRLRCHFPIKSGFFRRTVGDVRAVDDVNLTIRAGETLGIVGESGSGKSTLGMCLLRLQACKGEISFQGVRLDSRGQHQLRPLRSEFQIVFQDPYSSLSPRMSVEQIISEGLRIHFPDLSRQERRGRVVSVMREVGLEEEMLWRYPHEFSGGQRQRIAIARAMVLEPKLVLLDEPTSALDVSVQKQVLELLRELQRRRHISYLFISHDLKVIRSMAHRVLVMRDGKVVEAGPTQEVFDSPRDDYTRMLVTAALFKRPVND